MSGAADATVNVWSFESGRATLIQTIKTAKKYLPLAVALYSLGEDDAFILAVAGTSNIIQIFTSAQDESTGQIQFTSQATLPGHENWIRSLDFIHENPDENESSDLLLASASQDKYIRIWRIHQGTALSALSAVGVDISANALAPGNKIHKITAGSAATKYCVMFEALLLGHEDWIYTARWSRSPSGIPSQPQQLQLLSASADNSLSIWESDPESGIWITAARLGEVSREKGATTATGSIGGFWTGLWSPSGETVITLGRTGSWRRWDFDRDDLAWRQNFAVSGHTRAVTGISWSRDGSYLLSTSADQTTRLHAEWSTSPGKEKEGQNKNTWHEMSRPQIHGYDLNCIDSLGATSFVSGADEKLMRVFTEPKAVARMLNRLTGGVLIDDSEIDSSSTLAADAATMPVLGLSNKAIDVVDDSVEIPTAADQMASQTNTDRDALDPASLVRRSALEIDHPPFEESLSRHTLWPEVEKLYGHGYEISCLAASHDGRLIASACKASSLNHAVIRIFETKRWTEIRPPLAAHTLTVTRLRFSGDDRFLLSVGRDRQWAVFERQQTEEGEYKLLQANPKGHTRMILDAAFAPPVRDGGDVVFATAGRDKSVKVWALQQKDGQRSFELALAMPQEHPVTAIDFLSEASGEGKLTLAVGTEKGKLSVVTLSVENKEEHGPVVTLGAVSEVRQELCLPKAVMQLAWRPRSREERGDRRELAIAGEDGSLRIYSFSS